MSRAHLGSALPLPAESWLGEAGELLDLNLLVPQFQR